MERTPLRTRARVNHREGDSSDDADEGEAMSGWRIPMPLLCDRDSRDDPAVLHSLVWLSNHTNGAGRWRCVWCGYLGPVLD